jgi:hypothetical protein
MNVICPHCQQNFEMELEKPKKVETPIPSTIVEVVNLKQENADLRFENQRLQIINHYNRGNQ